MSCPFESEVDKLFGGEIHGDERLKIEKHLAGCPECKAYWENSLAAMRDDPQEIWEAGADETDDGGKDELFERPTAAPSVRKKNFGLLDVAIFTLAVLALGFLLKAVQWVIRFV